MARIRAADDFVAIRARMEELARERAGAQLEKDRPSATAPRPYPGRDRMGGQEDRVLRRISGK